MNPQPEYLSILAPFDKPFSYPPPQEGRIFSALHTTPRTSIWEQSGNGSDSRRQLRSTHNTFHEVQDIQTQLRQGLPPDRAHEYPRAQAISFLKEFAGGAGNYVTYAVGENGKLYAPGNAIPTSEALRRYAHTRGRTSRERADAQGFETIEMLLANANEGQPVYQLSPPSIGNDGRFEAGFGDYGFLNVFEKRGDRVIALHTPYFQESTDLRRTKAIAEKLGIELDDRREEKDPATFYISRPTLGSVQAPASKAELFTKLGMWGEWEKLVADERFFNETILKDPHISAWLAGYEELQVAAATSYAHSDSPQRLTLEAEELLIAAYNRAKILYGNRDTAYIQDKIGGKQKPVEVLEYYAKMAMVIQSGSCPAGLALQTSLSRDGYLTYGTLSEHLSHTTPGEWKKRDCVTCPMEGCGKVSTKDEPHLFNGKEWICANPTCAAHNPKIYKLVTNPGGMYTV